MFSFLKKNRPQMLAPVSGECIAIADVPDPVFSDKVLGDGVGLRPTDGKILSPVSGTVAQVAHTFHAVGIESDDGLEILVHLGIDTVKLGGEGFTCHVEVGQKIKAGDALMDIDLAFIQEKGLSTVSPCIITNMDAISSFTPQYGPIKAGETVIMTYELK